jgi:hypothetical protein
LAAATLKVAWEQAFYAPKNYLDNPKTRSSLPPNHQHTAETSPHKVYFEKKAFAINAHNSAK